MSNAESIPPEVTPEQLDAILAYLPKFEAPDVAFGKSIPPQTRPDGVIVMGYYDPSAFTLEFIRELGRQGFIYPFDWPAWKDEAIRLYEDPQALAQADLLTLRKLMTLHLRQDRFCEGHLGAMLEEGHITAILRRLKVLRDGMARASG